MLPYDPESEVSRRKAQSGAIGDAYLHTAHLRQERRGLLQWLSALLQPRRRKRSMTPDADAQPRYRRRPA